MYHYYLFNTVFIILFLFSFSISYYFYFHLSDFSWSWVGFAVLSRIGVIAFIIIYYHLLFFQRDLLCQKCNITPTITSLFSSRHIWKQVLIIFLLLFIGTRFKFNFLIFYDFYLFAVLISCLYFIIDQRVHNAFGIPWQVSSLVKLGTCFIQLSIYLYILWRWLLIKYRLEVLVDLFVIKQYSRINIFGSMFDFFVAIKDPGKSAMDLGSCARHPLKFGQQNFFFLQF